MKIMDDNILVQVLDHAPLGTVIIDAVDPQWPVLYMNPVVGEITGFDVSSLIGRPWGSLLADPTDLDAQREQLLEHTVPVVRHFRQRWQSRPGEALSFMLRVAPLFSLSGSLACWSVTLNLEVGAGESSLGDTLRMALRDAQQRLRQIDRRDSVTGLANREAFLEVVQRDWMVASHEQRRMGLIVFEVDALDRYRDTFGRQAADTCLRRIAHAINGCLRRGGDLAARVADHRFAALVGSSERAGIREFAAAIARRVQDLAIHHPRSPGGRYVTVSFGIASEVPQRGVTDNTLLVTAEADLHCPSVDEQLETV